MKDTFCSSTDGKSAHRPENLLTVVALLGKALKNVLCAFFHSGCFLKSNEEADAEVSDEN
jgi:hypothetical protein